MASVPIARWGWGWAAAALCLVGSAVLPRALAQEARAAYTFEDGLQGFMALQVKDGQLGADDASTLAVTKEAQFVKEGGSALAYTFKVGPGVMRSLAAEARVPAGTQAVSFWARGTERTSINFVLREEDGSSYQLAFYLPAGEWSQITTNLEEFVLGDTETDENGKLDLDQVRHLGFYDLASMFANLPEAASILPNLSGSRTLWLDHLQFLPARAPQTFGPVTAGQNSSFLVDNFESNVIRWLPVKVVIANNAPSFTVFPEGASLKVAPEAAGPGAGKEPLDPGGKGLRLAYTREATEVFALVRSLEKADLSKATRLNLSVNMSRQSLLIIQIKEKDNSEYNFMVMPPNSVGWQNLSLGFGDLTLGENSQDENGALDPDQIKEIVVLDASGFATLPGGETTLDLDAVSFVLR